MNENCTVTIAKIGGGEETFNVTDINKPYWDGCLTPEEFSHKIHDVGITIESLDGSGNKLVRYIPSTCICEVNVFCPCP